MRQTPDFSNCPNCGAPVVGKFCPECGQRIADVKIGVRPLFVDLLEDQFSLSSALPRTLKALFFQPGRLTNEYLSLRIARYVAPFRLYLISSLIFFLLLTLFTRRELVINTGELNEQVDSLAQALPPARPDPSARGGAGDTAAARAAGGRLQAVDLSQRCGRYGSGAAGADTVPTKGGRGLHFGVTTDSSVLLGLTADPNHRNWAEMAQVHLGSERLDRAVCLRLLHLGSLPPDVAIRRMLTEAIRNTPKIMFVLLPLFALLLKLLYIRRKRYYVEHFVFALHLHAFMFMVFTVMLLLYKVPVLNMVLFLWMPLYVLIAMKRVYQQGWVKTAAKWGVLGFAYVLMLTFAALTVFVGAIFTA